MGVGDLADSRETLSGNGSGVATSLVSLVWRTPQATSLRGAVYRVS